MNAPTVSVKVWGPWACFTRPEFAVERVSYPVMTPAAARNVLRSIHWKPQFEWRVDAIDVLAPVTWSRLTRNEVGFAGATNDPTDPRVRTQRSTLALRNVVYVIHGHPHVSERHIRRFGLDDPAGTVTKHRAQFTRRVETGGCFRRPFLGCREFAADFAAPCPDDAPDRDLMLPIGRMFWDYDYTGAKPAPRYMADAVIDAGRLAVPRLGGTVS